MSSNRFIPGKKVRIKNKVKHSNNIQDEITRKLGHSGWLKFPDSVKQELEDQYLQYKNLGLI